MKTEVIFPFNSETFYEMWNLWKQYKKEQFRFTYKGVISEQAALKKLSEDSGHNEEIAIKMIEQAIAFGWMGIFELKNNINGKQNIAASNNAAAKEVFDNLKAELDSRRNQ